MSKKAVVSTVIVPKIPTDALRNLAKLERRTAKPKPKTKVELIAERNKVLKTIWREEGIDAALGVHKHLGMTKKQVWDMIGRWMFPA